MIHEWLEVVSDPAHVLAELSFAACEAAISIVVGRVWLRRHDRKHHSAGE